MSTIAFYNGAAGMRAFQNAMNVTSHNISNVNTVGYKSQRPAFDDLIRNRMNTNVEGNHLVGHGVKQEYVDQIMGQGSFNQTDYPLDFAISGDGYFAVDNGGEIEYTRNGSFDLSVDGDLATLVTSDGAYVLDQNGNRITLRFEGGSLDTDGLGDRLGVYAFANEFGLLPAGSSRYTQSGNSGAPQLQVNAPNQNSHAVLQYTLENSTVDLSQQMVDVIAEQRAYQISSRVLQTADAMAELLNNMR